RAASQSLAICAAWVTGITKIIGAHRRPAAIRRHSLPLCAAPAHHGPTVLCEIKPTPEVVMNPYSMLGALAVGALLLSGCGERSDGWGDTGPLVSERRDVAAFDSIQMDGAAKLEITVGEP